MAKPANNELWGAIALRGVLAILFGLAAVFWPGITLVTIVYLFAAFILANGIVTFVLGLSNSHNEGRTMTGRLLTLLLGVLEIGVGVYLLRHTTVAFATLILLIGFVLIIHGVVDFFSVFFEEGSGLYKTVTAVAAIIAVVAGVLLLFQPEAAGVAFVWILGIYALISGPLLIALAMDLKKAGEVEA